MNALSLFKNRDADFWNVNPVQLLHWDMEGGFVPACDIEETDSYFTLSFDLPGVAKDDVKLEVEKNELVISGRRRIRHEKDGLRVAERRYGKFGRRIVFPMDVDASKAEASFRYGVLRIMLPKAEAAKPRVIEIREGKSQAIESSKTPSVKKEEEKMAA